MFKKNSRKDLAWLRRISSFTTSRIILTANNYRIFDNLEGRGKTAINLSKKINTDSRATELFLNSLTAIGLLEKINSYYRNSDVASRHLVTGRPDFQGDILSNGNTALLQNDGVG